MINKSTYLTQIILSLAILSASYINTGAFPLEGVKAMAVIMMSIMSIVILLHVCMPLNKYRSIVLIGTVVLMVALFLVDALTPVVILDINYQAINTSIALLGLIIFIVLVPLYFLFGYLFTKLIKQRKRHD